jgi:HK97 gp10 family phage protein
MTYGANGIKVKGFNQAVRALRELGVPDNEIKDSAQEAGNIVADEARSLAPVRTGRLRDSIRVNRSLRKVVVSAGNNRSSKSAVPYANPIHWGWFKRNIKPQPFFVKALGITRDEVYRTYYDNMAKLVAKQNAKGTSTDA